MTIRAGRIALLLIIVFLIADIVLAVSINARRGSEEAKRTTAGILGVPSLALSSDCTATRSLVEGLCACLGDVPGGYCFHNSCDIVDLPETILGGDRITVIHGTEDEP